MKLVDANVLLYSVNPSAEHHEVAKGWLDRALNSAETIVLPWASLLAFVRLSTHPRVSDRPLRIDDALAIVEGWTSLSNVVTGETDARHIERMGALLRPHGRGGTLVNDAHLAAIALRYDATVVTFDGDLGRFHGVRWMHPGA